MPLRGVLLLVPLLFVQAQDPPLSRREFESRFAELNKRLDQRDELNDRAVQAALAAMNDRLNGMNEFRATLRDQASGFVGRGEWNTRNAAMDEKLRVLELANAQALGRSQQNLQLIGVVGFVLTILTFSLRFIDRRKAGNGKVDRRDAGG